MNIDCRLCGQKKVVELLDLGKHPIAQLNFAKQNGVELRRGTPAENIPGKVIAIPQHPSQLTVKEMDLQYYRKANIQHVIKQANPEFVTQEDIQFLMEDTMSDETKVLTALKEINTQIQ